MHETFLENIYNKELFKYSSTPASKIVDGVEYISVIRVATDKPVMIRRDSVKVVDKRKKA
jgi:hypothetical protein